MKNLVKSALTAALVIGISSTAYAKTTYDVTRLSGSDRYHTSITIANDFQSGGTLQNIILASGQNFPDALAGSVLSNKYSSPILLLNNNLSINSDSLNYIKSHLDKSGNIYILGGTGSISDAVVNSIKNLGYKNFIRLGGKDRFETNEKIVDNMNVSTGTPVVISSGLGFADALSISSIASSKGYPIFLSTTNSLPSNAKSLISKINPSHIYVIGGEGSISTSVVNQLKSLVPSLGTDDITRLGGQTRYDTSLAVCNKFDFNSDTAVLASGKNFPDALSGSAIAAKLGSPIILTDGSDITNQKSFIDGKGFKNILLLGGIGSIDLPVEYLLRDPSTVPQSQIDYINSLEDYCASYSDETISISNSADTLNTTMNNIDIGSSSSYQDFSNKISQSITAFQTYNSSLLTYKTNISSLVTKVSGLYVPSGLESLGSQYMNNINAQINTSNKYYTFVNNTIQIFKSMKSASDNADMNKIISETSQLQTLINGMNALDIENGSTGIINLYSRLIAATQNLYQQ